MDYVRSCLSIPTPRVLAYSADTTNEVGSAYILMEKLSSVSARDWMATMPEERLLEPYAKTVLDLEETLLRPRFGAYGSIYYRRDVPKA